MFETADTDYTTDYERPIMSRYFYRKSEKITISRKHFSAFYV